LLTARSDALADAPALTRLLLAERLREDDLRPRFAEAWRPAVWDPLLGLFERLQAEGRLRRDVEAGALVWLFQSLNVGHLVSRHLLAPQQDRDDAAERAAVARSFARGAGWPGA
jgi:hypothetical protein